MWPCVDLLHCIDIRHLLQAQFPHLPSRLRAVLALWVEGTLLGLNGCQDTVTMSLAQGLRGPRNPHTLRRLQRELLTDTPVAETEPTLYACRNWIEQGFRGLKTVGYPLGGKWHKTRRLGPGALWARVGLHWLVLAIATLLAVAYGTRREEAEARHREPGHLRRPHSAADSRPRRAWPGHARGGSAVPHRRREGCISVLAVWASVNNTPASMARDASGLSKCSSNCSITSP